MSSSIIQEAIILPRWEYDCLGANQFVSKARELHLDNHIKHLTMLLPFAWHGPGISINKAELVLITGKSAMEVFRYFQPCEILTDPSGHVIIRSRYRSRYRELDDGE